MGLHICAYILSPTRILAGGYVGFVSKAYDEFDSLRYSGDRDFVTTEDLEWEEVIDNPEGRTFAEQGECYSRPKDLEKAKTWVKENIYIGNQPRLIKLLEDMEADPCLWLIFSW